MRAADRKGTLTGAVLALVAAGLGLATSFGVAITTAQHSAILTFCGAVAVVAPLVGSIFDHSTAQVRSREAAQQPSQAAALDAQIAALQQQRAGL